MNRKQSSAPAAWLMLVHQLPARPAYLRVKLWRRLQEEGAVCLKNSVYVLPASEQNDALLRRLLHDIESGGGEGFVSNTSLVAGLRDEQVKDLFRDARSEEYRQLARDMRKLSGAAQKKKPGEDFAQQLTRFHQRFAAILRKDFFDATGRPEAEALLAELEHQPIRRPAGPAQATTLSRADMKRKVWVTRQDIHVDRIACAWLIARFVDPAATFKFVPEKNYGGRPGELRYDMHGAEFTHEGDKCSFEVLLERAEISDRALKAIAQIIHDIDCKDGKFNRPETPGIAHVISGICRAHGSDEARMARGKELFDDTYEQFRRGSRRV